MEETLIIKNFGPIESVELKLKRFTILIGEQATGKSTVAKVLAVCRYFSYLQSYTSNVFDFFQSGLIAWGLHEHIQYGKTYIEYACEDYFFSASHFIEKDLDHEGDEIGAYPNFRTSLVPKSEKFKQLLSELEKISPLKDRPFEYGAGNWNIPTSFFQNDVARVMRNPFYIPTERGLQSIFSLGRNSIQNISDSLFNQFAKLDQIARLFKENTLIEPLEIEYKNEGGKGFIRKKGTIKYFSLYNGASGYQSTIPVVLSLEYYSLIRKKKKTFLIEEPELNLFPFAQNELMKYLIDKSISYNHQILLTTHSPYILTSINNLMYAYKVGQEHEEEVNEIIEKKHWLNPDDISAYRLLPDGTARNIVDELQQIDAGEIDEASTEINQIWDKISDIRFASVNEN